MIADFKRGDAVMWCPEEYPFEATVGVLLGFYDAETEEELPSPYDASNVLVNALVYYPGGKSLLTPLHELELLSDFIKRSNSPTRLDYSC
jgi:hypothetical protein